MLLRNQVLLVKAMILIIGYCNSEEQIALKDNFKSSLERLAIANNEFSFKLLENLQSGKNVFFSPFSIHVALAMLNEGARSATSEEIQHVLSYDSAQVPSSNISRSFKQLLGLLQKNPADYQLEIANSVVTQSKFPISKDFSHKMKNDYGALLKNVDFSNANGAVREINDWVSKATHGKITKLLKELDSLTKVVLLNAIYFKGLWENPFDKDRTQDLIFYNNGITPVRVPTMISERDVMYARMKGEGFHAISLPYKGKDISMIIILPLSRNSLNDIHLSAEKLQHIISSMSKDKLVITLPKFTMEHSITLNDNLKNLGMKTAFTWDADLSGISENEELKVSKVVHKAMIEVNEQGSTAAGSTGIIIVSRISPFLFVCDRPFLFIIRDNRIGMNLFMGQVNQL